MTDTDPHVTTSRGRGRRITSWVRGHSGLVMLLAAPVVVFGIPLLYGQVFLDGDNLIQNYPLRVLVGQDLIHGHLPLLNPYIFSGTPLLGGFNAGGAYPLTWLFAILPDNLAWTLNLIAAYEVAVVGMYLFLRRQTVSATAATFGAAAFAFGGFVGGQIVHIDLISGAAWLPWLLLAVDGLTEPGTGPNPTDPRSEAPPRWWWALLLAAAIALTILAGAPESVLDSAMVVVIYLLWRYWQYWRSGRRDGSGRGALLAPLLSLAIGVGVGLVASAAQWLPGLVFTAQSQRATPTYQYFTTGSLPWRLTALVFSPFVLGTNQNEVASYFGSYNFPEVTSYVGILALIAAFALLVRRWRRRPEASRWWVWYVVLVVCLVAAWGGNTPFGHVLFLIPGIKNQRLLNRSLLGVDFALAALVAWWVHMMLADRARARSEDQSREAVGTARADSTRSRARSRVVEVAVTSIPLVVVTVLCVGAWLWGSGLEQAIGTQYPSTPSKRLTVAAILTGGVAIAALATWLALFPGRWSRTGLRRALALVMAVDLVFFTALSLHGPVTQTTARATGPTADQLTAAAGNGRFLIYDPDVFAQGELYALGQTDLNAPKQLPSAQGYAALVDGNYYRATGAHLQQDLNPYTLAGSTWDDLNVTTLLSLPSYFVTPVPSAAPTPRATPFPLDPNAFVGGPKVPLDPVRLAAEGRHTWYFGGALTVTDGKIGVVGAAAGPAARIGLITPTGTVAWLAPSAQADHGALRFGLGAPTVAAGIVVQNGSGKRVTVATPEVDTVEDGTVTLDGRLQNAVTPPHWIFTGTIGSFGVFRNAHPRGWAWTTAQHAGGRPGQVRQLSAGRNGTQRFLVQAPNPVWLVRSEAPAPGWHATVQAVDATGSIARGAATSAPVDSLTVTQRVQVPAGDFVVTFHYAPVSALAGLALSAIGGL
ncbi:MAG TPA: hypothetical protein VNV87_01540, partial [Acidimicrobiales bacterium]|nr:hypothetical protein [Acidimicrobiales bacterium]